MGNKVYVGNIPYSFTNDDLRTLFAPFGIVRGADVIVDRLTGRSRGFGFVEMETAQEMHAAIEGLNSRDLQGRSLTVNEARERAPGGPGGGGGSGGGRAFGSGGGGVPRGPSPSFGAPRSSSGPPRSFGGGGGGDGGGRGRVSKGGGRGGDGGRYSDGGGRRGGGRRDTFDDDDG